MSRITIIVREDGPFRTELDARVQAGTSAASATPRDSGAEPR
jgi:hypothetical protein